MKDNLTQALVETVRTYRAWASQAGVKHLHIDIEVEGRVDGDWKINYSVREHYEQSVQGNTLEDVFREFLRRKGWQEIHQPICLPNVEGGDLHGDAVYGEEE